MPWSGSTDEGVEYTPPLLYLDPLSALFSVVSVWVHVYLSLFADQRPVPRLTCDLQVSAVHAFQSEFQGSLIQLYRSRAGTCSWELLDWILFECSTTATLVSFVGFWCVRVATFSGLQRIYSRSVVWCFRSITMPTSDVAVSKLRSVGVVIHFMIVALDFRFTAPRYKSNHVCLALLWPSIWLFMQIVWIINGHQPSNELFNFHTVTAPWSAAAMFAATFVAYFILRCFARVLNRHADERRDAAMQAAAASGSAQSERDSKNEDMDDCFTPINGEESVHDDIRFELMAESIANLSATSTRWKPIGRPIIGCKT